MPQKYEIIYTFAEVFSSNEHMKLVFATGNIGKLREASEILGDGFELVSLEQVGITEDIPETGKTLVAN